MYDPKFTQKQMYDQYGKSRTTKKSDPAPSRPSTFDQFKRRETNRGLGSKPRTFGGGQDNNPNRDEAESRSVVAKVYERAVTRFRNFGASEPDDVIVDGKRVYQGPLFRGFQPTMPTENFGGEYGKRNYLFGIEKLGIQTYPTPPSPTLPSGVDNPRLNMFGVNRRFTRTPALPELPTSPDTPANVDAITRGISQALVPTEVDYTIKVGDTLSEIAEDRGTTVEVLMQMNNIKEEDKDTIYAGDKLKVPPKKAKTYKDVDDNLFVSSGQIMSDAIDPDAQYYESFRQGITPIQMLQTTGDNTYVSADYMSELEILARTIEAEAGGESKKGKLAVGAVIKNRADQNRFGTDIRSVILFPSQFSPWNKYTNSAKGEQGKDMLGEKMKPSKDSYEAAQKILSGDYVDPTSGATHFVNPKISKPKWYEDFKEHGTTKIGKHEFGDADKPLFIGGSLRPKVRPKGLGAK